MRSVVRLHLGPPHKKQEARGRKQESCFLHLFSCILNGDVAQPGERLLCKQEVSGSIPLISTILFFENCIVVLDFTEGQVMKGSWWMPWRQKAMKDVVSCDKPRGAANKLRSGDFRMGQPAAGHAAAPAAQNH